MNFTSGISFQAVSVLTLIVDPMSSLRARNIHQTHEHFCDIFLVKIWFSVDEFFDNKLFVKLLNSSQHFTFC